MTWSVRHEGSPQAIDGLSLQQVLDGLLDGLWEPTDEVRGPGESAWVALESHPATADTAAEVESPVRHSAEESTHLDFTPLIDVCLVLLIFFILTTSYAAMLKRLDMPSVSADKKLLGPAQITKQQVEQQMIKVTITKRPGPPTAAGQSITRIENEETAPDEIEKKLRVFQRASGKNILLLEYQADVPWSDVIRVQDAANKARFNEVLVLVPSKE
jgi:biopolymer transport protein ExbD